MKSKLTRYCLIFTVSFALAGIPIWLESHSLYGKRVSTRLTAPSRTLHDSESKLRTYPSHKTDFDEVAELLTFIGYDKKASSAKETFFVDNASDYPLSSIELEISYFSVSDRQIHRRTVELKNHFPSKESRKVDIPSWDTQKSFHYINSVPSSKGSTPYKVRFKVLSFQKAL